MRNPDSGPRRYTSLAWAVVEGNEDMFEFLLNAGHDDDELSRVRHYETILFGLFSHRLVTGFGEQHYSHPTRGHQAAIDRSVCFLGP
jgi:ankyrin repeat protein